MTAKNTIPPRPSPDPNPDTPRIIDFLEQHREGRGRPPAYPWEWWIETCLQDSTSVIQINEGEEYNSSTDGMALLIRNKAQNSLVLMYTPTSTNPPGHKNRLAVYTFSKSLGYLPDPTDPDAYGLDRRLVRENPMVFPLKVQVHKQKQSVPYGIQFKFYVDGHNRPRTVREMHAEAREQRKGKVISVPMTSANPNDPWDLTPADHPYDRDVYDPERGR